MAPLKRLADGTVDWESVGITDDFMFKTVMSDPSIAAEFLEGAIGVPVGRVEVVPERSVDLAYGSKSVRYDVYVADGTGRVFDIEMQKADSGDLARRARYYRSRLDLDLLEKGRGYEELGDSWVLFVCTFDPVGDGLVSRAYEMRDPSGLPLGDGSHVVLLSSEGTSGEASGVVRAFLRYIGGGGVEGDFAERVDEAVRRVRRGDDWRRDRMKLEMLIRDERREAAREAAREATAATEARMARLVGAMLEDSSVAELRASLADPTLLPALYERYGIDEGA